MFEILKKLLSTFTINIYKTMTYLKTLKYTYEQSLVKKGAPSQAFIKN